MVDKAGIVECLYAALDELNEVVPPAQRLAKSPDTVLFGADGKLDSFGLVNLIVIAERVLEDRLGVTVTLANDQAMSIKNSPFRTVDSLADYTLDLVAGGR
jgi:hypothetical protein